jgi:hypothetical protein
MVGWEGEKLANKEKEAVTGVTRFPGPGSTPPSPPFHVPNTALYTEYTSTNLPVGSGRARKTS